MRKKEKVLRDFNAEHFAMAIAIFPERKQWQAISLVLRDMSMAERKELYQRLIGDREMKK